MTSGDDYDDGNETMIIDEWRMMRIQDPIKYAMNVSKLKTLYDTISKVKIIRVHMPFYKYRYIRERHEDNRSYTDDVFTCCNISYHMLKN
jgi:hypothetical protein